MSPLFSAVKSASCLSTTSTNRPRILPMLPSAVGLVIRTWNLYHGRTHPKTGRTYLERMVRLVSMTHPMSSLFRRCLSGRSGGSKGGAACAPSGRSPCPNLLGPVARFITDLDPARMRFALAGQANAILLNRRFEVGEKRTLVLNPEVQAARMDPRRPPAPRLPGCRGRARRQGLDRGQHPCDEQRRGRPRRGRARRRLPRRVPSSAFSAGTST